MGVIGGLDHALIGVRDLEAARAQWRRLGFALTPRGRHIGWGTGNYCIMFRDDYLELLGIVDPAQPVQGLDALLAVREGLLGLAFTAADGMAAAETAMAAAGIAGEGPQALSRRLELPEGTVEPAFRVLHPDPPDALGVRGFVCEHLTPELMRQPAWLAHPNTARRLRVVTAAVPTPMSLFGPWRELAGATQVVGGGGGVTVRLGETLCHFGAAEGVVSGLLGLAVEVGDLDRAAAVLTAARVDYERVDREITIDPVEANGVALSFLGG